MTVYPPGRWRFDAGSRYWRSGHTLGPYVPVGGSKAQMLGGYLTSPGGVIVPPDPFTVGATKPIAANTGVTPGVTLTDVFGDVTLSTPGTAAAPFIYSGKRVHGVIFIRAAYIWVVDCEVLGQTSTTFANKYDLIDCRSSAAVGFRVYRCTLHYGTRGQWWTDAVGVRSGASGAVERCDIYGCVDGLNIANHGPLDILGNYIHDLDFCNNSANQAGSTPPYWTHNDGVQISGGGALTNIRGNNFWLYAQLGADDGVHGLPRIDPATGSWDRRWGCGVTVSPDQGVVTNQNITENWFEGGTANFQSSNAAEVGANLGTIGSNRFGMDQYNYGSNSRYQIRYKNGIIIAGLPSNYFDPDAPSVPAALRGVNFTVGFTGGIRID